MTSHVPVEILAKIISNGEQNTKLLTLVHKSWISFGCSSLFKVIIADSQCDILAWMDLFNHAPDILFAIRHVTIAPEGYTTGDPVTPEQFIGYFPRLRSVAVLSLELDYQLLSNKPLESVRCLVLNNCYLPSALPFLRTAFPNLCLLHIIDYVAGSLASHNAANRVSHGVHDRMEYIFLETRSASTVTLVMDALENDDAFSDVDHLHIRCSPDNVPTLLPGLKKVGNRIRNLLIVNIGNFFCYNVIITLS